MGIFDSRITGTSRRAISVEGRVKMETVRKTIGNLRRYDRATRDLVRKAIHQAEAQIIDGARAAAAPIRDKGKLHRGIRRRPRRLDGATEHLIRGGVKVSTRHALPTEAGTKKREARPFFYQQIDTVFPRFEKSVREILATKAIRRAVRGG